MIDRMILFVAGVLLAILATPAQGDPWKSVRPDPWRGAKAPTKSGFCTCGVYCQCYGQSNCGCGMHRAAKRCVCGQCDCATSECGVCEDSACPAKKVSRAKAVQAKKSECPCAKSGDGCGCEAGYCGCDECLCGKCPQKPLECPAVDEHGNRYEKVRGRWECINARDGKRYRWNGKEWKALQSAAPEVQSGGACRS